MSKLTLGSEAETKSYRAPEIEEVVLAVSNAFLDAIASGEDWTEHGDD